MTTNDDIFPPELPGFPPIQGLNSILDDEQRQKSHPETRQNRLETCRMEKNTEARGVALQIDDRNDVANS